jgi:hypothetical protein
MSVRFVALLAVAASLVFAPSNASAGLFGRGCCDAAPSCGDCGAAPSCGCEIAPSCGCEVACDPCARPRLFSKLISRLHSRHACCDAAPACGCEAAPSCCAPAPSCCAPAPVCCEPAPSCGCEVACDPCAAPRHRLFGGLKSRLGGLRGCFAPKCCGCEVAPSCCGCNAAPSCGCGM